MKALKFIRHIGIFILCVVLNSCSDFLDNAPDDQLTLEMVFNDKTRTEDWLANIYSGIPDCYWQYAHDSWDVLGDELSPSQALAQVSWTGGTALPWRVGQWFTDSNWDPAYWKVLPQKIRSAYIFIHNAHANPLQNVTEEDVETMKSECRFLIAYYYWLLTEAYGAVPFYEDVIDVNAPQEELMKGQMAFDDMINWIDAQLVDLSTKLPAKWEDQFFGRATSVMCHAVRARMLLFAASPLVNGNEWYVGFKNYDGKERFNTTYDPTKWTRAAKACKELLDAAHAAGHKLYVEHNADGSIDPFMSCANAILKKTSEGNTEILFARPDCNYKEFERKCTPRGCGGSGYMAVTQSLVDAFFMKNGLSPIEGYNADGSPIINEKSGYTERGFSKEPEIRNTKWDILRKLKDAKPGQITQVGTYNMYANREPRFYLTVTWNREWFHQEGRVTKFMYKESDGGPTHDAPQTGYLNRKKFSLENDTRDGTFPYRPGILYRLGEAYLNYAEALNEAEPGNPDILKYLNLVRERAGIPQYGSGKDSNGFDMIPVSSDQGTIRELIRKERHVELCCEGIRYHDLRRWKLAEKYLNGSDYGMNINGTELSDDPNNPKAFFKRTKYLERVYSKKCYWIPVHQNQIDRDPTLVQAPFWVSKE